MYSSNVKQIIKYMLKVPVVKGDINRALKQFKRKFRDTQVLKELRERKHHIKKSTRRKLIKEKAVLKQKYREENGE